MDIEEMTVEEMEDLLRELYERIFGGSIEELKGGSPVSGSLNPGLDRCTVIGTNEEGNIEIRFQDEPACEALREEYREILMAALGGAETVYKTLK